MKKSLVVLSMICIMASPLHLTGHAADANRISNNEVTTNGIYSIREIEQAAIDNSLSIDNETYDAIIRKYTLLNGKLDYSNLEEQISNLEETAKKTITQINKIKKALSNDDEQPIVNPDKMTVDEISELEEIIVDNKFKKSEKEDLVETYRGQLLLHNTGLALLTEEEKSEILTAIEAELMNINDIEDSIMLSTVTLSMDQLMSSTNPYKMTTVERKELNQQKRDLSEAYDSYKKEAKSLKKQLLMLEFQNASIDLINSYDDEVMDVIEKKERMSFQLSILEYMKKKHQKQLKEKELEYMKTSLERYEIGNRLGYVNKETIEELVEQNKVMYLDIDKDQIAIDSALFDFQLQSGIEDITDITIPDDFFAIDLKSDETMYYLEGFENSSYLFGYMDELIEAYQTTIEGLGRIDNTHYDREITEADIHKLKNEQKNLYRQAEQTIIKLLNEYKQSANAYTVFEIDLNEAKRQYDSIKIKFNYGYATYIELEDKLITYELKKSSQSLHTLEMQYVNLLLDNITRGVLLD